MFKKDNEITVKINESIENTVSKLEALGFKKVEQFKLTDYFFIRKDTDFSQFKCVNDILNKSVLVRYINKSLPKTKFTYLSYKNKVLNNKNEIIEQTNINNKVDDKETAKKFLYAIGYYEYMTIEESDMIYKKDEIEILIKDVLSGDNLIEFEQNEKYNSIDKLKNTLKSLNLNINTENWFIRKAEIEFLKKFKFPFQKQ